MGFTYFNTKPVRVAPTTQEILASLTGIQKGMILDAFAKGVKAKKLAYKEGMRFQVVKHLYDKIDEIEGSSRAHLRGEIVITPAVIDLETGEITTPTVFNTPPSTAGQLLSAVQAAFLEDFTSTQVTAILTKMVEYSKWDGSGDWTFYKNNVIL